MKSFPRLKRSLWPFDQINVHERVPGPVAESPPGKLGEPWALVYLQPFILRWSLIWGALSIVLGGADLFPGGLPRLLFQIVVGAAWIAAGIMTIALLVLHSRHKKTP